MVRGIYLGFRPPHEAASVLAGADALLVVMSFEPEHRRFMQTSFTTKFLDYTAFCKPIVVWGPEYCTPVRIALIAKGINIHGNAILFQGFGLHCSLAQGLDAKGIIPEADYEAHVLRKASLREYSGEGLIHKPLKPIVVLRPR